VKSIALKSTTVRPETLHGLFRDLEKTAVANFRAQGNPDAEPALTRTIAMRYEGQNYEQEIPVPGGEITDEVLTGILERYHELHNEFYGYRLDGLPVELVRLTVTATAAAGPEMPPLSLDVRGQTATSEPPGARTADVYFGDEYHGTPVVSRSEFVGGGQRPGPLIVESMDTTVVVPPGWTVESDATGILELRREPVGDPAGTSAGAAVAGS
jgi:N-methylhydantoinase A